MPDILMCRNVLCKSKDYCYRFTAIPSKYGQYYANYTCDDDEINCLYFYSNGKDSDKCKLGGVKRDGEICNLTYCTYPKCVQDKYCPKCHQINGVHKMGCETRKVTIKL